MTPNRRPGETNNASYKAIGGVLSQAKTPLDNVRNWFAGFNRKPIESILFAAHPLMDPFELAGPVAGVEAQGKE